ncbi:hypothetical protein ACWYBU_06020 [Fusobacterium polymorphum]|jgi:hypothetical protein|nr:MAG TPA: putative ATPase [Caudoviricetes sp.]
MKLSKLYCNDKRFKTVYFKEGFNLILGNVDNKNKNDTHNLGKTTLIEIVDYMLLKSSSHFFNGKSKEEIFKGFEFFLEVELDKGFVTIKRSVKNPKISLQIHNEKNQDFIDFEDWDFKDIKLDIAKNELNKLFNFDLKSDYRKFLKFILRTQEDYSFDFRKNEVGDIQWKPYIMELFGYGYKTTYEMLKLRKEKEEIDIQLSDYNDKYFRELEEKKSIQRIYEEKIKLLKSDLEKYNYNEIDKSITDELVKNILNEISKLNTIRYNLQYDIQNIRQNIGKEINTMDISEIEMLYKEAKIYFGKDIIKDYKDLIKFNEQISKERIKSLNNILEEKEKELVRIEEELKKKNEEQKNAIKILENNNMILKILSHNDELKKYELEEAKISRELEIMQKNIDLKEREDQIITDINKCANEIRKNFNSNTNILSDNIKNFFSEYTNKVLYDLRGDILLYPNLNGYPDFKINLYSVKSGKVTAENDGNSYNKHIKCCLDLSIVTGYIQSNKKFFQFLFHDASIEAVDLRLKKSYLELVEDLCNKFNIQYITTAIYDEVSEKNIYKLLEKNIILKLNDSEDYSGTLFGFRF